MIKTAWIDITMYYRLPWIALERWTNLSSQTTESDVYSYGMTIWEIFSGGERPLSALHNIDQVSLFIIYISSSVCLT